MFTTSSVTVVPPLAAAPWVENRWDAAPSTYSTIDVIIAHATTPASATVPTLTRGLHRRPRTLDCCSSDRAVTRSSIALSGTSRGKEGSRGCGGNAHGAGILYGSMTLLLLWAAR